LNCIGISGNDIVIRKTELSQLLEEMRLLRRDFEQSIHKQNELRTRLDESIRHSQSPRQFTFSGQGVSTGDLRIIGSSTYEHGHADYSFRRVGESERTGMLNVLFFWKILCKIILFLFKLL
jgi:hypothetical protein